MQQMNKKIDTLLKNKVCWLNNFDANDDIAISSRIRLARNLKGLPFPIASQAEQLQNAKDAIELGLRKSESFGDEVINIEMAEISALEKGLLQERRIISNEFVNSGAGSALILKPDETLSIMINEEDHIRMQAITSGFDLHGLWEKIGKLDSELEKQLPYEYDEKIGYLTSCPTNVGTGLRASVMLHLPGLVLTGNITSAIQGISKLRLAVRGLFGEGSDNQGNLFQISNQSTLGESEIQIIDRICGVIKQLINHEKNARLSLLEKDQNNLLDKVGRAYGNMRHAYIVSSEDAMNSLSSIRLGVDMGMFSIVDLLAVNELFVTIHKAHLQYFAGRELTAEERDVRRAAVIRERLKNVKNNQ
jgi:protein arginine kinase